MAEAPKPSGQTLDQKRAAFAWKAATAQNEALKGDFSDYKNLSKAAPMMVMTSGLMATFAFYQSRGKVPATRIVTDMMHWLAETKVLDATHKPSDPFSAVMLKLQNADSPTYQRATQETLLMLRWLRQFADAIDANAKRA